MALPPVPIHVIDFEGSRTYGVVEFGVVTLQGSGIAHTRTRICEAMAEVPEAEARVHGLRARDTMGEKTFGEERDYFFALRESGPLCAHSASVEEGFLKRDWPYPRLSPDFLNPGRRLADWGPWIDTLRLYERLFPMLGDHSLQALITVFELQGALDTLASEHCPSRRRKYHCALYDALGSALLLDHIGQLPGYEAVSLEWLITMSQPSSSEDRQRELF